ncbi:MAG: hypothetical protein NZ805_11225 [Armatimonadetes bacterium]|nr:hypothetical protein [Armatimonadota bacterium]MDW8029619.1 hypothetical protein [Armatimonadota bacterium]
MPTKTFGLGTFGSCSKILARSDGPILHAQPPLGERVVSFNFCSLIRLFPFPCGNLLALFNANFVSGHFDVIVKINAKLTSNTKSLLYNRP